MTKISVQKVAKKSKEGSPLKKEKGRIRAFPLKYLDWGEQALGGRPPQSNIKSQSSSEELAGTDGRSAMTDGRSAMQGARLSGGRIRAFTKDFLQKGERRLGGGKRLLSRILKSVRPSSKELVRTARRKRR